MYDHLFTHYSPKEQVYYQCKSWIQLFQYQAVRWIVVRDFLYLVTTLYLWIEVSFQLAVGYLPPLSIIIINAIINIYLFCHMGMQALISHINRVHQKKHLARTGYKNPKNEFLVGVRPQFINKHTSYDVLSFMTDTLACAPIDGMLIGILCIQQTHFVPLLKAYKWVRLLKLVRLYHLVNYLQFDSVIAQNKLLALRVCSLLFFLVVIFSHSVACVFMVLYKADMGYDEHYVTSLYWTIQTLTTIGYGDIPLDTNGLRLYAVLICILRYSLFGIVLAYLELLLATKSPIRSQQLQHLEQLRLVLHSYQIPPSQSQEALRYQIYASHFSTIDSCYQLLKGLPLSLQNTINSYVRIHLIKVFTVFQNVSPPCLFDIASMITPMEFGPHQLIIHHGEEAKEMYFLVHGKVEVLTKNMDFIAQLTPENSGFFGESALLLDHVHRNVNIRSLRYTSVFRLNKKDFTSMLKKYPQLNDIVARERQKKLSQLAKAQQLARYFKKSMQAQEASTTSTTDPAA